MGDSRLAEMIAKMAHELRSPLTSLKGFSAMLVSKWDRFDDRQRFEFVETIHHDAERMSRIVAEVLDLARMEAGRLELKPTTVVLGDVARAAAESVRHLDGAERIALRVPDDVRVYGDRERLGKVLANLLENAVKFSDEGEVEVTGSSYDDAVEIVVRDRGVGIESERLEEIFLGPAPRLGGRAAPSGGGLGLYLSRGIVELHGGSITVESSPGEGSVFTVRLPLAGGVDGG